ncbi:MAG TPA: hypothetical protein VLC09_16390, partial [Polyangiaceae bacterium]|nr:hypothetical protein [Polyangiaceae bacterium]
MSRVLGIDARDDRVRALALNVSYRKLALEATSEQLVADHGSLEAALRACFVQIGGDDQHRFDTVVTSLEGQRTFVHRLSLPAAAQKRLDELLPFELEAQLPVEIDEVVFAHEVLPRARGNSGPLTVLTVSARTEHVRGRIELFERALGRGPDRVGATSIELGQLARVHAELRAGVVAVLELGRGLSDVCLLDGGIVQGARSLGQGVEAFPSRAQGYLAQLRQTLSGFATATGRTVERIRVTGEGARLEGLCTLLAEGLGVDVAPLAEPELEGVTDAAREHLAGGTRALSAALHGARGKGFDLRQGPLAYQRGYSYLKERAPLLAGMGAAVVISFLFATWAEGRVLDSERESLVQSLEQLTKATFGEAVSDPEEAMTQLDQAQRNKPEDPMPYMDGLGVAAALAETMPEGIRHDAEEFDFSKGKLKMRGVVDSTDEVQRVAKALDEHRCIENATVTKIS